jgi:putative FmdB family regulatory protein
MPLFDFRCRACGHDFEALIRPGGSDTATCPSCESTDLEKLLSTFAVSSAERTQSFADTKRKKAAAVAHRDNAAIERETAAHRAEDH